MSNTPAPPARLRAHGAVLGGGTGVGVAGLIVGLVQQHISHTALAPVDIQAIYAAVSVLGAAYGTWILPLLSRIDPPAEAPAATSAALKTVAAAEAAPPPEQELTPVPTLPAPPGTPYAP